MGDDSVRIALPGWSPDRLEALEFLLLDAGIDAAWVDNTVLMVPAEQERRVLRLVEFLGSPGPEERSAASSGQELAPSPLERDPENEAFARWAAAPGLRLAGFLVDGLIVGCLLGIPVAVLFSGRARLAIALLVSASYSVMLIAWRGQTVGNRVVRTRVLSLRTARVPSFSAAVIRWSVFQAAGIASLLFDSFEPVYLVWLFVVCVPILFTTFRQGIHDLAANVVVIDERIVSAYEQIGEMASGRLDRNDLSP